MDLKDLKAVLKLCRSQGVTDLTMGDLTVKFGDMPKTKEELEAEAAPVVNVMPSEEELAYWSAAPDPLALLEDAKQ
jgi:hypothetical protein